MANYPQKLAHDAVCQNHTGHMTGLWFLPTRPLKLNTNEWWMNEWMNIYIYIYKTKNLTWQLRGGDSHGAGLFSLKSHARHTLSFLGWRASHALRRHTKTKPTNHPPSSTTTYAWVQTSAVCKPDVRSSGTSRTVAWLISCRRLGTTCPSNLLELRSVYTGPPGWSARLNQWNWIQRLNDTVYTVPQKWTRQSISKWRQMNLCRKVLL